MTEETLRTYLVTYYDEDSHERTTIQKAVSIDINAHGDLIIVGWTGQWIAAFAKGHWLAVSEK